MNRFIKIFLILITVIYLFCLYKYLNVPVMCDMVKYGTLEESIPSKGYVIKKENCIYSNISGEHIKLYDEGAKVPKGAHVITVYTENYSTDLNNKVDELNERIASVSENINKNNLFSGDIKKLDSFIEEKINTMIEYSQKKDYKKVSQIKENINKLVQKKVLLSGREGKGVHNLSNLIKQKEEYEKKILDSQLKIKSDISGIISYDIDGKEQFLKPKRIEEFTVSDFLTLEKMDIDNEKSPNGGQAVAKIIDNFEWYVGLIVDNKEIYNIKEGQYVKIRFKSLDDEILTGKVEQVSKEEEEQNLVIVKLNKYIESLYSIRQVEVDLIKQTYSGYKIPTTALRMINDKLGVFIIRDSVAKFCEVDLLYKNNDFAIIKENNTNSQNVLLYDELIVKGKDIYDGKLIR